MGGDIAILLCTSDQNNCINKFVNIEVHFYCGKIGHYHNWYYIANISLDILLEIYIIILFEIYLIYPHIYRPTNFASTMVTKSFISEAEKIFIFIVN